MVVQVDTPEVNREVEVVEIRGISHINIKFVIFCLVSVSINFYQISTNLCLFQVFHFSFHFTNTSCIKL